LKRHFIITNNQKINYAKWLQDIVSRRVDAIVSNKYRGSYCKAAFLVCILDECLTDLNAISKSKIINEYKEKYKRYSAFRKEIDKLK